jgi:hypothetical protein
LLPISFRLGRIRRLLTMIAFLSAFIWGVTANHANAYQIAGQPWPGKLVTYTSVGSAKSRTLVDRAARVWNRADVGFRLIRRPSADAAVLVSGVAGRCRGQAYIGYPGALSSWLHVSRCPRRLMVLVLAHEFGHVLGMGHEWRHCALMNSGVDTVTGTPGRCAEHRLAYWIKHPLRPDDIRGGRALAARRTSTAPSGLVEELRISPRLYDFAAGVFPSA